MNSQLHPIMQQALSPFAPPPERVLKAAAGNRSLSPLVAAKVYQVGKNQYEVTLACAEWDKELHYRSADQFGQAFKYACWFSILSAENAQYEIDVIRAHLLARQ